MSKDKRHIIIVGGGAAGMMAATAAAGSGCEVTLFEQNEKLGKKLFITGKGRCNLTNASLVQEHLDNAVSNPRFLYSALSGFDADAVCSFFTGLGLELKTERGRRVFPKSDHSSDVIKALEYELRRLGVEVHLNSAVADIIVEEGTDARSCKGVILKDRRRYLSDGVIMATGGVSYPLTGASGSGLGIAKKAGLNVTDLYPALVPLVTGESWTGDLAGLSLKNVSIIIKSGNKKLYEDFGKMLFTHRGVSGPLILSASSHITGIIGKKELKLYIDLKPALTDEMLDKRLIRELESGRTRQIGNVMGNLLPRSLIPVVLGISGVREDKKACDIRKEERAAILKTLKSLMLTITGTEGFDQAVITQGGINVKEINPKTMEAKKIRGLYFAGECIDVDSLTGGYNLQIAWATGYAAGMAAAEGAW